MRHEAVIAFELSKDGASLGAGEDDGKLGRAADALHADEVLELSLQHLLVKKEQRAESLFWVEAATRASTARWLRKAAISASPMSPG